MGGSRIKRIQFMVDNNELFALNEFRIKSGIPTRPSAIRVLLRRGLALEGLSAEFGPEALRGLAKKSSD